MKSHKFSLLDILTFITGFFVIICYGLYLGVCIVQNNGLKAMILPAVVILLASVPIVFRKKLHVIIRWIFCAGMSFYMVTFLIFTGVIMSAPSDAVHTVAGQDNVLVMVYGCRTFGYTPSNTLKLRLDKAYEVLEACPDSVCVVSGGQGSNETVPEAHAMREYLVNHGVDGERIYIEDESHSTIENIKNTVALIEENGFNDYTVIGVSSEFHLPRIKLLCGRYGFDCTLVASYSTLPSVLFSNLVREYMAYVKLLLLTVAGQV